MQRTTFAATLFSLALMGSAAAQAPLVVNVTPDAAPVGVPVPPGVGVPVVINGVTYARPLVHPPSPYRRGRSTMILNMSQRMEASTY